MNKNQRTRLEAAVKHFMDGRNIIELLYSEQTELYDLYQDDDKKLKPEDKMPQEEIDILEALTTAVSGPIEDILDWSLKLDEDERYSWNWLFPIPPPPKT
jgi:hypothetical protein